MKLIMRKSTLSVLSSATTRIFIEWRMTPKRFSNNLCSMIVRTKYFLDDTDAPIRLYTDASDYGIGGVLFQIVDSIWRPIAFVSKSFNGTQSRWSTIQKEAYAIFYCCQQMDTLLRDRVFTIDANHLNLTYVNINPNSMVTRCSIAMQELDFKIHFVPGSQNKWADTLSRLCPNLMELAMDYTPLAMDAPGFIVAALTTCPLASEEESEWIEQAHNFRVGHGGVDWTMHKLGLMRRSWPYIRNHVRLFIRYCPCYQKMSAVRIPINVHKFTTAGEILFDALNIDFIGPFPDGTHVLVIINSFLRWTELSHCKDNSAESACYCLLEHFGRFGSPTKRSTGIYIHSYSRL